MVYSEYQTHFPTRIGPVTQSPVVHPEVGTSTQHVPTPADQVQSEQVIQQQQPTQPQPPQQLTQAPQQLPQQPLQPPASQQQPQSHTHVPHAQPPSVQGHPVPPPAGMTMPHPAHMVAHQGPFPYAVYGGPMDVAPRAMHPPTSGPPQTWQAANGIAPSQTHIAPPPPPPPPGQPDHPMMDRHPGYGEDQQAWTNAYHHMQPPPPGMVPPPPEYAYRYREDQAGWVPEGYYPPHVS